MDFEFSATPTNLEDNATEINFQVDKVYSAPKTEAQLNLDIRENKLSQEEIEKAREAIAHRIYKLAPYSLEEMKKFKAIGLNGTEREILRYIGLRSSYRRSICFASYETIEEDLGFHKNTIRAAIAVLLEAGCIEKLDEKSKYKTLQLKITEPYLWKQVTQDTRKLLFPRKPKAVKVTSPDDTSTQNLYRSPNDEVNPKELDSNTPDDTSTQNLDVSDISSDASNILSVVKDEDKICADTDTNFVPISTQISDTNNIREDLKSNNNRQEQESVVVTARKIGINPEEGGWMTNESGTFYIPPDLDISTGQALDRLHESLEKSRKAILTVAILKLEEETKKQQQSGQKPFLPAVAMNSAGSVANELKLKIDKRSQTLPSEVVKALESIRIEPGDSKILDFWNEFGEKKFRNAVNYQIAYEYSNEIKKPISFFESCLRGGWGEKKVSEARDKSYADAFKGKAAVGDVDAKGEAKKPAISCISEDNKQWLDRASSSSFCEDRFVDKMGELAVVFDCQGRKETIFVKEAKVMFAVFETLTQEKRSLSYFVSKIAASESQIQKALINLELIGKVAIAQNSETTEWEWSL